MGEIGRTIQIELGTSPHIWDRDLPAFQTQKVPKLKHLWFAVVDQFGVFNLGAIFEVGPPIDGDPVEGLAVPTLLPHLLGIQHVDLVQPKLDLMLKRILVIIIVPIKSQLGFIGVVTIVRDEIFEALLSQGLELIIRLLL